MNRACYFTSCMLQDYVLVMPENGIWSKNFLFCTMWAWDFPCKQRVQFKANPQLLNLAGTYCGQYYVLSSEKAWWKSRSRTTDWWGSSHRFPSAPWKCFYQTVHRRSDSDRQHFGSQPGRLMKRFVRWQRQRNNIWCASDSPQCVLVRFQGDFCKWGLTENFSILK